MAKLDISELCISLIFIFISVKDAIEKNSFLKYEQVIQHGNLQEGLERSDYVLEGEIKTGGQQHFYLETQCALVVPKGEENEIDVYLSSQYHQEAQVRNDVSYFLSFI